MHPNSGSARSRKGVLDVNKQQPKISIQTSLQMKKELAPPTHSICSPISNPLGSVTKSSPVQNVPTNLSTSNQGPLPSFASIVSSSKFFNPGLEAAPPIRNPMVSSGLPTTCTILSGVKASSAASSIAPSVQNSVPRIDTKSVTAASKAKPKTAQRTISKNVSVSKNPIVSKSIPTTIIKASSVKATPQINAAVTTGAMSTNNTLLAVPSNIGSTSAVTAMTVSVSSPSHLPKAPIKRTIVSSPVSISLAASIAPRTTFSQASSLSSTRTGTTSSLSVFTTAAATKVVACSSISATTSTAAAVGSKVAPFVSQMVVESKSAKDAASPVITTSEIAATGAFTSQNADSLRSIVSKQPVNTKATAKSGIKPAARSRVAKPRTTAASKKQGLKALANAARLVSAKIPTSANSFGLPVSVGVSNPVMASYVQSSVQKTTVPPSSVIESVMTPTLWNPALMSKYGQSSQQSQSQSYVSGMWSTVLSPNISSSLPGLRHPPPSATAPTIVSTAIQSAQHRIEGQSTGVSTASTFTSTTASIARTPAPNSRPELSQLPKTSVPIQVVSTSSQQASSASTNQTQSASQGSGAHGKEQLPAAQNILNPSHVIAGANPAVVSAVPQVQPAIVAPISSNVFYQGAAVNQMYNPQSMDVNQLKALGQYQVQWPALYPGQLAANTMAVLTTGQEKGSTAPVASVNQQGYPNPFMFGIIMPTAQPGGVSATSATGSSVSSTMTSSVASTAVAAAYGSYVPIAPAATPRFSQTLAHLANAYNPYGANLRGVAPSNNQLQFTYRMMQMSAFASGGMGHNLPLGGGVGAPSPSVPDYSTLKYPLGAVKQMSYGATVSSVSTTTAHNSMARTPVSAALQTPAQTIVAAMPYVPMTTQVGSTQHPSAFNSPTTPMVATTRTSAAGGGPCTYGMMTAAANIDPKTGNTTFGYLFIPPAGDVANNTGSETNVISAPISNSCVTTAETTVTTSLNALTRNVQNQAVSQALNLKTSAIGCVNPPPASPSTSSLCTGSSSASTTSSPTLWTPWSTTTTGVAIGAADSNPVTSHPPLPSKTNSTVSPMNTIFSPKITPHTTTVTDNTQSMSNRSPIPYPAGIHGVKADTKSRESPLSISPTVKTFVPCENSKSPLAEPKGQKRSYFEDVNSDKMNSSSEKRTKYDFKPSSFVETDPLLGMKRSCEAIEVYPIHGDLDKRKCSDNENCGEENSDEVNEDDGDDHTSEVTETRDGWKDSSSAGLFLFSQAFENMNCTLLSFLDWSALLDIPV